MYPAKPGLIIGFHGCDKKIRDAIIGDKSSLKGSNNDYDWLGHGMYFWENNQQRALDFARALKKNPRQGKDIIKKPTVLGAVIDMGFCLDLLDTEYLVLARESYQSLKDSCNTLAIELPVNKKMQGSNDLLIRRLDCSVIENLHRQRELNNYKSFDSVRGVFVEGQELYPGAGFNEKNHIQICIRNPNCIKGFFIPRTQNIDWTIP